MAKTNAIWGIDIGDCALKALRCRLGDDGETLVADAFDYIEYPKILSQPDAEPDALVQEALSQFLSRNPTKGDKVAISVSGQAGLARFIKLPPVESKKIPDLVKFEARQQIPFPLEEVIWDYQQLPGGTVEEGYSLETEVGLFAMKREQVDRELEPFDKAGIELDIVQLTPLCLYNFASFDSLPEVDYDPNNPPPSIAMVSMGTETTDLVITNGYRVWQRSIPIGGNHFTKQLTKELKMTFAKAEHLKRNVRQAENPKAIITAMSPVFKDLVSELQRSIGFFRNNDRKAKIERLVVMGNAAKLPSFSQYISSKLDMPVDMLEDYKKLSGENVIDSPAFKDNILSFAVCYGLAVQGAGKARLSTNLLPKEILVDRMIRQKKPWAVATLAALMLAIVIGIGFRASRNAYIVEDKVIEGVDWASAASAVDSAASFSSQHESKDKTYVGKLGQLRTLGTAVVGNSDGRLLWQELLRTINQALPRNPNMNPLEIPDPAQVPFTQQQRIYVESLESEYFPDLTKWWSDELRKRYMGSFAVAAGANGDDDDGDGGAPAQGAPAEAAEGAEAAAPAAPAPPASGEAANGEGGDLFAGPTGAGWVIQLRCYHYFNASDTMIKEGKFNPQEGGAFVRNTLLKNLREGTVFLPAGPNEPPVAFTMKEMGISYPTLVDEKRIDRHYKVRRPSSPGQGQGMDGQIGYSGMGAMQGFSSPGSSRRGTAASTRRGSTRGAANKKDEEQIEFEAPRYDFVIQFCWQEKRLSERLEEQRKAREEEAQKALEEAQAAPADSGEPTEAELDQAMGLDDDAAAAAPAPSVRQPAAAPRQAPPLDEEEGEESGPAAGAQPPPPEDRAGAAGPADADEPEDPQNLRVNRPALPPGIDDEAEATEEAP